jgi:hypothetical protein
MISTILIFNYFFSFKFLMKLYFIFILFNFKVCIILKKYYNFIINIKFKKIKLFFLILFILIKKKEKIK